MRMGIGVPRDIVSPFDPRTEVGRALAQVEWAATDLGPWESWPVSLLTAVRAMLASRFSMCMLYGESSVFLCNDAYRIDSLGDKFPWALGRPMATVWPEVWHVASERIRSVFAGESTWDEDLQLFLERSGYTEETFHTFSYGPLHDDVGRIVGVLCVVAEDTGKVLAARRMSVLRDLGAALTDTTTSDTVALAAHRQLSVGLPDLPFVLSYLADPARPDELDVHWAAGAAVGSAAAPSRLTRGDGHPWTNAVFDDDNDNDNDGAGHVRTVALDPSVGWPCGPWESPPTSAAVLPMRLAVNTEPYGYLVVGLNPFRRADSEYLGFVELLADQLASAHARADAFESERDRHDQLAELDRAKTTFFTNISHELRTPLTLLVGPAADALDDVRHPLDPAHRERFDVIARNAARMLQLVNTLLDFSRLEAGHATARYEQLDLDRFTAELAGMFESAFARAGLTLQITCPPLPQRPYVDREMWAKIVLNLLSNALKATFDGGVTVLLRDGGDVAVLEITDTGVGIPADEVGRLFERFHRVAGARQRSHEGSGIGLALVAELVRLHGGDVRVRSEPGSGTTFTVTVPYGLGHLPADQVLHAASRQHTDVADLGAGYLAESLRWSTEAGEPAPERGGDTGRPAVLVVDDSADVREYVRGLLADDYEVTVAHDGEEALAMIREAQPDLVVTDVMMPVLDGFGLLAAIRADRATAHLPGIMLSARGGEMSAVEGLEAGADDYLVKPFSARELRARVHANLELDRVRQLLTELQRSREMLDNAERLARLGSWEVDLRERTLRVSPQLARTVGAHEAATVPTGYADAIRMTSAQDEARLNEAMAAAIAGNGDVDIEVWAERRGGERFRARVRASVAHDEDGSARYLRGSTQDVTEQRQAEAELAAAHAMREVAAREHAIATELQRSLLPVRDLGGRELDVAAFYRAGDEGTQVGGDWYDVIDLGDGRSAVVIGDVMGRGVRAAAVMGQLRAATRAYARLSLAPADLMLLLDDTVRELGRDMIVTCVYAVYDPVAQTLDYANAGHLPPLLRLHDGEVRRLRAGGPPLGAGRRSSGSERVAFPPGAVLVLYTDGLVERRHTDLEDRIDLLARTVETSDAALEALPEALVGDLLDGVAADAGDDVAVLVCRNAGALPDRPTVRHDVESGDDAISLARRVATEALHRWHVTGISELDVQLAVSELVTNAINHGGRPIELVLTWDAGTLRLSVCDHGGGRPVVRHSGPEAENGRGLFIVVALAAAWGVDTEAGTTTVWCEFRPAADGEGDGEADLAG